ncbi:glutaredoxin family protein [Actinidia rufa]|uniref:Glutaredoxin family protein n=1 Tax=Actinidia rufa TaxID=165716 RepID=A0A7J0FBP4_9ERIC|nr:glutaredoxin family protein [Actinidia rufa]
MGCSASRPHTVFTRPTEEPPYNPSSSTSSSSYCLSSPISRTLSLPTSLVHHPPLRKGDTNHLVSLTSSTYGSLVLVDPIPNPNPNLNGQDCPDRSTRTSKTVTLTDPDSVINTWELMEDLDEFEFDFVQNPNSSFYHCPIESPKKPNPCRFVYCNGSAKKGCDSVDSNPNSSIYDSPFESPKKPNSCRFVDCNGSLKKWCDSVDSNPNSSIYDSPLGSSKKTNSYLFVDSNGSVKEDSDSLNSYEIVEHSDSKPLWKHLSEESLLAKMDPNVVSSYRRALTSKQFGCRDSKPKAVTPVLTGTKSSSSLALSNQFYLPGSEDRIVLYYTSLRGIRRTFEDCCAVRMIFRGFRVFVDERDISMDSAYRKELQSVLGGKMMSLPQVFIGGKYAGGADEIKQLHECGELAKLLEEFPVKDLGYVCESCGDARFMPCPNCNGSRKVFEEDEGKLIRCQDCNENGLIRCPSCCS